jgi:hypothetical protein
LRGNATSWLIYCSERCIMDPSRVSEAPTKASGVKRRWWFWALTVFWLTGVSSGLWVVWAYENQPGLDAHAPHQWPSRSALVAASDRPTLVFLAHPQCSCTRASIAELAEILARATTHPKTYVLFLQPSSFDRDWDRTDLWRSASALPNVTVLSDDNGVEAARFGVYTSGETLLYDGDGSLMFSGGVTGSRGHEGDNDGEHALVDLLTRGKADRTSTSVFGCPIFASAE